MIYLWVEQWWESDLTSNSFVLQNELPISGRALRDHADRYFRSILDERKRLRARVGESPSGETVVAPSRPPPSVASASTEARSPVPLTLGSSRQVATETAPLSQADFFSFDLELE
ncbi:MAG: hypothetical protein Q8K32_07220 [Archangium sp.]|nr:hypothetical protein [Archangium sp.]